MFPFLVDKTWFETFWYGERVRPKRRSFTMNLTRFAVCVVLVLGGALVVGQFRTGGMDAHIARTHSMME